MRTRLWFVIACWGPVTGCGLISGLDQLAVGDASTLQLDAATDVHDANSQTIDANLVDVHDGGQDVGTVPFNPSIACGPNATCSGGQVCCLEQGVYACAQGCPTGARVLNCDDSTDCQGSTAICCGTLSDAGELLGSSCVATTCAGIILCSPQTSTCKCTGKQAFGAVFENVCQ